MEPTIANLARRPGSPRPRTFKRFAAVAGVMIALAGCKTIEKPIIVGSVPDDYRRNHPIAISESLATMDVPVGVNTARLPDGMRQNVAGFARSFVVSGSALIAIVIPKGSPNTAAAATVGYQIQDELVASGIDPKAIDMRSYAAAAGETSAPVRIAYARIAAGTAPCGPWPDQAAKTADNRHYFNYGCASQTNLAAMVDNPLDLIYPRGDAPPDATRRMNVLRNYEAGKATQSDYSKEVGASEVARGVGN